MAKYGLNKVTLIGNLGKDPELKYLDSGVALATVRLACTERSRDKDGNYTDKTEWVSVNLWRNQAEIVSKYCRTGSTLYIEGRLKNQSWETPQGEKRSRLDIDANKVILLDGRGEGGRNSEQGNGVASAVEAGTVPNASLEEPDDLPF
ncbi:MAG: single-stranded DNA-binding protein [Bacteroidota bacterium]